MNDTGDIWSIYAAVTQFMPLATLMMLKSLQWNVVMVLMWGQITRGRAKGGVVFTQVQ